MQFNLKNAVLVSAVIGAALYALPSDAQSWNNDRYEEASTTDLRIMLMLAFTAVGFGLGWYMSPAAQSFRHYIAMGVAAALALVGLVDNGIAGWSAALVFALGGFAFGIGYFVSKVLGAVPTTFGSSRWANAEDLQEANVIGADGIRLGSTFVGEDHRMISYKGDRHLLTVAPTRSGKGTTQIIPNLLTYEGSVLVIDPKGENALITARQRQVMGQKVHIVDPWGIAKIKGIPTATFNPLDWLKAGDRDITENAMILADALVVDENHQDSFWTEEAKALLQGIILYVATDPKEDGQRHLGRVRELLLLDGEQHKALFQDMWQSVHHVVKSTGARSLQKDPKLLSNVIASAQAQTHFLDSERLQDNLKTSSFKMDDLKNAPTTIYLVLPADRLNTFGRWLRLLVQQSITINARNIDKKPAKPILFILDEFAALGRLSMVEQAYGLMAGFGMQIWGIVQDLNQLERIYDKGWESFISNAGMINYFGSSDRKTAEYFSALCGETTVWNFTTAVSNAFGTSSSSGSGGSGSSSETHTSTDTTAATQRKLMYPDELMRLRKGQQIVFFENTHPTIAVKTPWFEDSEIKHLGENIETKDEEKVA
jgi:type IV secretion system protein VirD4